MAEGIEADAAEHAGGGVAETGGGPGLGGVVQRDGQQEDDVLKDREGYFQTHRTSLSEAGRFLEEGRGYSMEKMA